MENHMSLANNAPATQVNYIRGVRHLMITLDRLPEDCTIHQIKGFLVKLREAGQLSSSSINIRVCGLNFYFRHVAKRIDLVVGIPNPRIAKYHTEVLDGQELKRLFTASPDLRQLLIVQLLFDAGLRSGELIRIQLKDFDKENRTIILRKTKGQILRVVPYGEYIRIALTDYIKVIGYFPKEALLESYKEKGKRNVGLMQRCVCLD
jgi:integrase/recombinase XerD